MSRNVTHGSGNEVHKVVTGIVVLAILALVIFLATI